MGVLSFTFKDAVYFHFIGGEVIINNLLLSLLTACFEFHFQGYSLFPFYRRGTNHK